MKLSKNKLTEYTTLYLNDISDYGEDGEHELAESILSSFNTIDESEENIYETIKSTAKTSPTHKQVISEFLEYLNEIPEEKHEIKNVDYFQQLLNINRYPQSQRQFLQNIIDSVKRQKGWATERQFDILQRIKSGDFNYGKK
jgi:hypothetical protein